MKKENLGQYYTPKDIADLMVSLTSIDKKKRVLEPSFGEGVFLQSLKDSGFSNISGIEIDRDNWKKPDNNFFDLTLGDFFKEKREFDLIIGNPPYLKFKNIEQKTKNLIEKDPTLQPFLKRQTDLFYFFIIKSISLLADKGELIFIVPGNFRQASFAQNLREYMSLNGSFFSWIDLSENKIFKDAGPDPIIFGYKKGAKTAPFKGVVFKRKDLDPKKIKEKTEAALRKDIDDIYVSSFKTTGFEKRWYIAPEKELERVDLIEKNSTLLKNIASVSVGFVSGKEDIFSQTTGIEKGAIRKFVKGKDCQAFSLISDTSMIFLNDIEKEKELKEKYPKAYLFLLGHKKELLNRHGIDESNWWHWPTVRNKDVFQKKGDKIFVPAIDRSSRFRFSKSPRPLTASGDVLAIVPEKVDVLFLLAWFNSKTFCDYFKTAGPRKGGRQYFNQRSLGQAAVLNYNIFSKKEIEKIKKMTQKEDSLEIDLIFSDKIAKL